MTDEKKKNAYQVVMPRLGLTMTEGKIVEWYKQDGEFVNKGEPLFAIENEKASLDIESPASGTVKTQVPVFTVVPILKPVALIFGEGLSAGHHSSQVDEEETQLENKPSKSVLETNKTTMSQDDQGVKASPRARSAAKKYGINLNDLTGSGIRGMIVMQDVLDFQKNQKTIKATPLARRIAAQEGVNLENIQGSGPRGMVNRSDVERCLQSTSSTSPVVNQKPLSELRSIISSRLSQSWMERPQVTLTTEADATLFVTAREQINQELKKKGVKLSFNTLLIKLTAKALEEFPYMNVSLMPEGLVQHEHVNMGLAVDTESGLMVPVLKDVASKNFETIQNELNSLVERTLSGKNNMDDLKCGTFTITNLGVYEIDAFSPLINPPECGILGVGRIHEKPVGLNGQIVLRSMMALSLSFDHRLVDGAPAARFLQRIKQFIEQPFLWPLWKD
jgi:pyruvate dehydrogenase E2 component (dihydrolipoamide acetyltransferase)